ncbi:MAG: dimethyladenosine transferase, rRNA (adenine1518-N6/adenine1519-N6)-dimethyltransferase [Candidatus Parcubacteria bacterium]|jgi:16S rRNA (adenine1518-N6/adenine1519-N6)-dimethyltransferase
MDDIIPNEIALDLTAKKSLGQNFLKNPAIIEKISRKTQEILNKNQKGPKKPIKILEIGPGKGALTESLLKIGNPVQAIEADERMTDFLTDKFQKELANEQFSLIHQDIRQFSPKEVFGPYILVANIPYYLTGYIFKQFLESEHQPLAIIVMIQKEVALRMTDKKQSLLSLCATTYGKPSILTHVSKGSFVPMPKVDSSVLVIDEINKDLFGNTEASMDLEKTYWVTAKKAFNSKRKQVGGTVLKDVLKDGDTSLNRFAKQRPEELLPRDWVEIAKEISLKNL